MGESIAGEVIGIFCGVAMCAPYMYQVQAQLITPTRSPLPWICWILWSLGFTGMGTFFLLVPRAPHENTLGAPESPRTLGCLAIAAAFFCQIIWALDSVSPAADIRVRLEALIKRIGPTLLVSFAWIAGISCIHGPIIKSRPFYRDFLAFLAFLLSICQLLGSLLASRYLTIQQISQPGPEVAGLHWMPTIMQMLGYFAAAFSCTLIYTNPEWYGVSLFAWFFIIDAIFVAICKYRAARARTYDRLPA